jgi:hypothetical protein
MPQRQKHQQQKERRSYWYTSNSEDGQSKACNNRDASNIGHTSNSKENGKSTEPDKEATPARAGTPAKAGNPPSIWITILVTKNPRDCKLVAFHARWLCSAGVSFLLGFPRVEITKKVVILE